MNYGKLIELLNEYEKVREKSEYQKLSNKEYKWYSSYFFPLCFGHNETLSGAMSNEFGEGTEEMICSKKFGFIKWLVENKKIDLEKLPKHLQWEGVNTDIKGEELVIMVLSIQDTPIEFLISILK